MSPREIAQLKALLLCVVVPLFLSIPRANYFGAFAEQIGQLLGADQVDPILPLWGS